MQNSNDAGDISEEECNSLDGEGKLNRSVLWAEKNDYLQWFCHVSVYFPILLRW